MSPRVASGVRLSAHTRIYIHNILNVMYIIVYIYISLSLSVSLSLPVFLHSSNSLLLGFSILSQDVSSCLVAVVSLDVSLYSTCFP